LSAPGLGTPGLGEFRESGVGEFRDKAGVGTPGHGASGHLSAPGLGTPGLGEFRESGVGEFRDKAGVGTPGHGASGHLSAPGLGTPGLGEFRESGVGEFRDKAGVGTPGHGTSGHLSAAGVGTPGLGEFRESGLRELASFGTKRGSGLRDTGLRDTWARRDSGQRGGSRDSPPAAKAQEGRGKKWVVFQKKVCHGRSLNTGGGGLPNPTESTTWGPCSLEGGAGQYASDPRRLRLALHCAGGA